MLGTQARETLLTSRGTVIVVVVTHRLDFPLPLCWLTNIDTRGSCKSSFVMSIAYCLQIPGRFSIKLRATPSAWSMALQASANGGLVCEFHSPVVTVKPPTRSWASAMGRSEVTNRSGWVSRLARVSSGVLSCAPIGTPWWTCIKGIFVARFCPVLFETKLNTCTYTRCADIAHQ